MTKIDTTMENYEGKVVPQVQVLQVKKFDFEKWWSDPSWKKYLQVKYQITKNERIPIWEIGESFPMVLTVCQTELRFGRN